MWRHVLLPEPAGRRRRWEPRLRGRGGEVRPLRAAGGAEAGRTSWSRRLLPVPQALQQTVNVLLLTEALKQRNEVQQLCVSHVVEPGLHRDLRGNNNNNTDGLYDQKGKLLSVAL